MIFNNIPLKIAIVVVLSFISLLGVIYGISVSMRNLFFKFMKRD